MNKNTIHSRHSFVCHWFCHARKWSIS